MSNSKVLYVCQEIKPYLPDSDMSVLCRTLLQAMQERGNEIRTFMPRYGVVNERRNQLHEVIRLSGMNLIINDNDHQLIIKVASIPSVRAQIYFIDNDDYFQRKAVVADEEGNFFPDNDERAIFFARGVIETVKKLQWAPDIVHCHGWFSSITPLYLKYVFANNPVLKKLKTVITVYDDGFSGELDPNLRKKLKNEGINAKTLDIIEKPTYENLMRFVISNVDGVIFETEKDAYGLEEYAKNINKPSMGRQDKSSDEYLDNYQEFYNKIRGNG